MDNVTTEQSASLASELIQNIVATGRVSLQSNNIRLPPVPQNSGKRQCAALRRTTTPCLLSAVIALSRTCLAAAVKSDSRLVAHDLERSYAVCQ